MALPPLNMEFYLGTAIVLYVIGFYCFVSKRNMIKLIIGLEILIDGAHLNFIAFSAYANGGLIDPLVHAIVITSIVIGGCIAAVAMALILTAYRQYKTINIRELRRLKE